MCFHDCCHARVSGGSHHDAGQHGLQFERWQISLYCNFYAGIRAIWEIWEFTLDTLAGAYLTKPLQHSNTDTMIDLITDLGERLSSQHWEHSTSNGKVLRIGLIRSSSPDSKKLLPVSGDNHTVEENIQVLTWRPFTRNATSMTRAGLFSVVILLTRRRLIMT